MVQIDGLEIIAGLEEAYFKIVQWGFLIQGTNLQSRAPVASRAKKTVLAGRSLFVSLQPYYVGLSSLQKTAWTTYWGTLPYGDHDGMGEWPGSGFSAFVYVNAPRVRDGLSLIMDAPTLQTTNWSFELGEYLTSYVQPSAPILTHFKTIIQPWTTGPINDVLGFGTGDCGVFVTNFSVRAYGVRFAPNLVFNPHFTMGLTGWTVDPAPAIPVDGGALVGGHLDTASIFQNDLNFELGTYYVVEFDWKIVS